MHLSFAFVALCCCGDKLDPQAQYLLSTTESLNALAAAVEGIQSKDDADRAAPAINRIVTKLIELKESAKSLEEPSAERQRELDELYVDRMLRASSRLGRASSRANRFTRASETCNAAMERVNEYLFDYD